MREIKFKRKFGRQKTSKPKKGIFLVLLLLIAILLWYKAESLMNAIF